MGEMIHWWSDMLGQGEVNLQISEIKYLNEWRYCVSFVFSKPSCLS